MFLSTWVSLIPIVHPRISITALYTHCLLAIVTTAANSTSHAIVSGVSASFFFFWPTQHGEKYTHEMTWPLNKKKTSTSLGFDSVYWRVLLYVPTIRSSQGYSSTNYKFVLHRLMIQRYEEQIRANMNLLYVYMNGICVSGLFLLYYNRCNNVEALNVTFNADSAERKQNKYTKKEKWLMVMWDSVSIDLAVEMLYCFYTIDKTESIRCLPTNSRSGIKADTHNRHNA